MDVSWFPFWFTSSYFGAPWFTAPEDVEPPPVTDCQSAWGGSWGVAFWSAWGVCGMVPVEYVPLVVGGGGGGKATHRKQINPSLDDMLWKQQQDEEEFVILAVAQLIVNGVFV